MGVVHRMLTFVNKGTWLVKSGQKSAYVIYERPLTLTIITGRQFSYDRALQIMQDETYLENSDFDEIKKIGQFDANMNIPEIRQKWISKAPKYKYKGKTHNTHGKSGHSHRVKR